MVPERDLGGRAGMRSDDNQAMSPLSSASPASALPVLPAVPAQEPDASPVVAVLGDWGLIAARGEDVAAFLHGQLTQDIATLGPGQARLAGYCSAKGRLLATFIVWRGSEHEFFLACSSDLLAATMRRLSMFVLRARCRLTDASAEHRLVGLSGLAGPHWPSQPWQVSAGPEGTLIRLPDACGQARALQVLAAAGQDAPASNPPASDWWNWLEVRSAVPRVVAATVERFVPQMVNLEVVGGVHFQKGCYPGQEVVARSQYRGTLKRRAFLFEAPAPAHPGQDIFAASDPGQPAGTVVLAAAVPGEPARTQLLAEMKIAEAAGGLHLGAANGPALQALDLPYPLPAEA